MKKFLPVLLSVTTILSVVMIPAVAENSELPFSEPGLLPCARTIPIWCCISAKNKNFLSGDTRL